MRTKTIRQNESGIASLVIAILIVIVLSTIVLGFMQIIRRDQRRSLDRQLSQQAYYAAESGINDATKAVNEQGFIGNKTSCGPTGTGSYTFSSPTSNQLAGTNVRYTCLLIDQTPSSIVKTLTTNSAKAFALNSAGGLDAMTFSWTDAASVSSPSGARPAGDSTLPPAGSGNGQWRSVGLIRLDIVPTNVVNQSVLEASARSIFLYPNANGGATPTVNLAGLTSGDIVHAGCAANICKLNLSLPLSNYYVRAIAYYQDVSLTVTAALGATPISNFTNGQIVVDSTGKASDVTRRIQERIDPTENAIPDFALASMDTLCKQFVVKAGSPDRVDDSAATSADRACAFNPGP